MPSRKTIGAIAVATPFWFLAVYLVMAGLRPDYSYLTKAVSELGSVHAPHRWFWNILGYVIPGLAIALLGAGLRTEFRGAGRSAAVPAFAVSASGLFMALSGVFPGNFVARTSPTMIAHTVASLGSYVAFLIAGLWLPFLFRKHRGLRWAAWPSLGLVIASLLLGRLELGRTPGLGQRLVFACYFLWIGLVGCALLRGRQPAIQARRQPDPQTLHRK